MSQKARTRFAPSPTGFLHVGGVRTALFAWLVARQGKGQFILRIEDTDKAREIAGSEKHIQDSLRWLGLQWDEGPDKSGSFGPYRQSERLHIYKEWAETLVAAGRAYADHFTVEELNSLRTQAVQQKKPFLFRNHRPNNPPAWDGKLPLRFKSNPKSYQWQDEVMGDLSAGPESVDDFIIIKSDGYPTYNFAHVIDDYLMEVSHVIRSQEFLASVPKFLNLYEALEINQPKLATLPYVLGAEGRKKLSKRDGAKDVLSYKNQGFLPEALVSFLATLGWNDGTDQEIFSVYELVEKFKLSKVQKSGAQFDETRLKWVDGYFIRQLPIEELEKQAQDFWPPGAQGVNGQYRSSVLGLVRQRLKCFAELPELTVFFFKEPEAQKILDLYTHPQDKQLVKLKYQNQDYVKLLRAGLRELDQSSFDEEDLAHRLNNLLEKLESKPAILFPVLRIAVSGSQISPELFGTLSVLGKAEVLDRLKSAIALLEK
ncbi:glutamate--tRNA ligase [Candidatus Saccharibacteria bacterium]|nr:glutamate--tRNA ligase [Candidatus Saccharibacteria bacterium]